VPEWLRPYLRPREGWLSYFLLFVMLLSLGWAVQSTGWLDQTDFLVPVAFWGSLLGVLLGLTPLTVVATLPISALAGTWIVLWAVGGEYFPLLSQTGRLLALRTDAIDFTRTVLSYGYPTEVTPYAIGLGLIMWITAFIAAYTIYRHHRVLDAIVLVGAALVANMAATTIELVGYLVLFVLAALLLWLRGALVAREDGWRRRRVNENVEVPTAIMRTGVAFIAGTIAVSWILTSVAVAHPLTDAWQNLDVVWSSVRDRLDTVFGGLTNENARLKGDSFGSGFTVQGSWFANDSVVLLVSEDHPYYLETATYDIYTGHGWTSSKADIRSVGRTQLVFPGPSPEKPSTADGFEAKTITIKIEEPTGRNLFTPGVPLRVTAPSVVSEPRGLPFLGALSAQSPISAGEGYSIDAAIPVSVTEKQLQDAGTDYPDSVKALYMDDSKVTPEVRALAQQIVSNASATTPYDEAKALAHFLSSSSDLSYATDVGPPPANRDLVDFFLFDTKSGQRGYCQYFASAMAMMARALHLPARLAVGFAPGTSIAPDQYVYKESNAHVWAQIYFPGYGWQTFESTKSINPQFIRDSGVDRPLPPPVTGADATKGLLEGQDPSNVFAQPSLRPINGGTVAGGSDQPASTADARPGNLLIIFAILLAVAGVIWWRLRRSGRRLRFLAPGERQWALLLQAADRAGVSQRASETDYEYAGWLEEQIPARRPEIHTIADAKVWGSYSGRGMTMDTVERMQAAWRRLRLPFVWLAIRRRIRSLLPHRGA
jgi:transglutaminase-like putative cysteine protease